MAFAPSLLAVSVDTAIRIITYFGNGGRAQVTARQRAWRITRCRHDSKSLLTDNFEFQNGNTFIEKLQFSAFLQDSEF